MNQRDGRDGEIAHKEERQNDMGAKPSAVVLPEEK